MTLADDSLVAVIGVACRFPGAASFAELWENLCAGKEGISFFSPSQLSERGVSQQVQASPSFVPAGGVVEGSAAFDAELFQVSARNAALMDPQVRKFLECAFEVLDATGYQRRPGRGPVGLYAGAGFKEYLLEHLAELSDPAEQEVLFGTDLAATVSRQLDLRGPSLTVESACATGLLATHLAAQAVLSGECEVALAGAVWLSLNTARGYERAPDSLFSADGHCRSFDAKAAGTVPSGGVGVVALKLLSAALRDRDVVYGVLRGSAINHDGQGEGALATQVALIGEALAVSGVSAEGMHYVEAQGLASLSHDAVELRVLSEAFAAQTARKGFCALGATKPNLGHLAAASGMAMLFKALGVVHFKQVPPLLHFREENPELQLSRTPFRVERRLSSLTGAQPVRAGLGLFGGGTANAYLILEGPPAAPMVEQPGRATQLLLLSGATPQAVASVQSRLREHLLRTSSLNLADVSFSQSVGRAALPHRRAIAFRTRDELLSALEARVLPVQARARGARPVVFLFPARFAPATFESLYQQEPTFRSAFDALRGCLPASTAASSAAFLCAAQCALVQLWGSWGIAPSGVASEGAGRFAAAFARGAHPPEEAVAQALRMNEGFNDVKAGVTPVDAAVLELGDTEAAAGVDFSRSLVDAAGKLWEQGASFDVGAFYRTEARRRVLLPAYPFDTATYSLPRLASAGGAEEA